MVDDASLPPGSGSQGREHNHLCQKYSRFKPLCQLELPFPSAGNDLSLGEIMKARFFSLQVIRFGIVGLSSNLILYLLYLGLTSLGLAPKLAMSILYVVGVLQTFVVNKKWTFHHHGHFSAAFTRYVGSYVIGYLINLSILMVMVDRLGYPHQLIQGLTILMLAVFLFSLQKMWVFRLRASDE